MWDGDESDESNAADWGRANAETSISLSGMDSHPVCWFQSGASPATLTFHLEHTIVSWAELLYYHW
eukprot:TRINITY_DN2916_c0_g1_i1.p2 TRINITY_DN2916_c0_g1~~TRINITY_DN2916_c0_g1_i1.p2  ORF type:complete len:66 (-),score=4.89 TRINITY_DN2916_c0_g1_i1:54-251(-)